MAILAHYSKARSTLPDMNRRLLLTILTLLSTTVLLQAQTLFTAPDTVCIRQDVTVQATNTKASNYYFGFCSGYLQNVPVGTNLGVGFGLTTPSAVEAMKDGNGNYYAFIANGSLGTITRLDYGTSLSNTPTPVNLGTLNNTIPAQVSSMYLFQDGGKWYMFIAGGTTGANSAVARLDFGTSLGNVPNSVLFGNLNNLLAAPRGICVAKDGGNYYGYLVNSITDELIRLDFGLNISLTPTAVTVGNLGGQLSGPSDIAMVQSQPTGNWYLYITNYTNSSLIEAALGNSLANAPTANNLGNFNGRILGPSAITRVADCGADYFFITDALSNELTRVDVAAFGGPYSATNLGPIGAGFNQPSDISRLIREHDNIYSLVTNPADNTLSLISYNQCSNASIASATVANPAPFQYAQPGLYNIFLSQDEGLPSAVTQCKQIRVLPIPDIVISNDTLICQGDTAKLYVSSFLADSIAWSPNYNVSTTQGNFVEATPDYSSTYYISINYTYGCIVDTFIHVNVSKNKADAGPDRTIFDGASTVLGGPLTTVGTGFSYKWFPAQYINNEFIATPTVNPANNLTYYLQVTNAMGCVDVDTVIVKVECNDLNLPNAFAPESQNATGANRFGILNSQIVQLNYFRVFDRWGHLVFETTDVSQQWDGTVDGKKAEMGVYVWEADGFCTTGKRYTRSGNVTLIR